MGNLQSALTSKALYRYGCNKFKVGTASMQGCRQSQEDAHKIVISFPNHPKYSFFGVFDGHGGEAASKYLKDNLTNQLNQLKSFDNNNILKETMLKLDERFFEEIDPTKREHGSTCVFVLVKEINASEFEVTCVNVGDSRAILIYQNGNFSPLSSDHKPNNYEERKRIINANGCVISNRVDGNLAVSRAFGDWSLKNNQKLHFEKQKVIALPDIVIKKCNKGDSILITCDGIYEHLDNSEVVQIFNNSYEKLMNQDPAKFLCHLFKRALDSGSTDNMTGILVNFCDGLAYPTGNQYIPGKLFKDKENITFLESYILEAKKNNLKDTKFLRLMAYHQDLFHLKENDSSVNDGRKKDDDLKKALRDLEPDSSIINDSDLIKEIIRLEPITLDIKEFAYLINAIFHYQVISKENTVRLDEMKLNTAKKLREYFEEGENMKIVCDNLNISEKTYRMIMFVFGKWDELSERTRNKEC